MEIVVLDYEMGNPWSIVNMFKRVGVRAIVSRDVAAIRSAQKLVIPGVGAFDQGMANLDALGLVSELNRFVERDNTSLLGICLGMQLLTNRSEEGQLPGLGFIDAETSRFQIREGSSLKVPHMGWNSIDIKCSHPIVGGLLDSRFYYVHSYKVECNDSSHCIAACEYIGEFSAIIGNDRVVGTQFHPEKSHKFGLQLLKNFVEL